MVDKRKMMFRQEKNDSGVTKIYIYDNITAQGPFNWETWEYDESETSAKHFISLLDSIQDGSDIELHINSYGGEVKEGVAIYNLLKAKQANKICHIDCFAYSVAYVIALGCDKIIMHRGSTIMLHNMWCTCSGNATQLRKAADDLDEMMAANRQIFLEKCNLSEDELMEMLDKETILSPDEALKYGFCDEVDSQELVTAEEGANQFKQMYEQLTSQMNSQKSLSLMAAEFIQQAAISKAAMMEKERLEKEKLEKEQAAKEKLEQKKNNEAYKALTEQLCSAFFSATSSALSNKLS
jgi:ATP-dependent protease ClpP protease subunit